MWGIWGEACPTKEWLGAECQVISTSVEVVSGFLFEVMNFSWVETQKYRNLWDHNGVVTGNSNRKWHMMRYILILLDIVMNIWIDIWMDVNGYIYIYSMFFCSMFLGYDNDFMEFTLGAQQWTFDKRLRLDGVNTTRISCFFTCSSVPGVGPQWKKRGTTWNVGFYRLIYFPMNSPLNGIWVPIVESYSHHCWPCHDITTDSNIPYSCWSILFLSPYIYIYTHR